MLTYQAKPPQQAATKGRHRRPARGKTLSLARLQWQVQTGFLTLLMIMALAGQVIAADVRPFFGRYQGSLEVPNPDGSKEQRDATVRIGPLANSDDGFYVQWTTTSLKKDGRRKTKSYNVEFQPTERADIFAAAMKRNVFGHTVQLDPMKGEPYVWGRIIGDTLTVFSMFIGPNGDYEMQQYDRTLAEGGLDLVYSSHRNGFPRKELKTFLERR
ncbi:hypothetical protein [Phaeobacter piscinae]|uniref:DUF4833 domain-containing protein n=1 Tax=Phaeobacter piscinae TaxID=1580596 RepID=A0ABM6PCC4_9RHOB|nr:hypothetical protein [Phaeobacter piscinae]ATG35423.1 hypothetical protein PhaeoP36_01272 [Phaeobacter piscinae]ATG39383.1 hypothetical protein PhaeoP14_01275 [Phaeobacter piscinae]AUQ85943.1 hypothetical protein PhaeoP42_01272 [Phaeobacter piscinae]AUR23827.1 hypothetical protein PhaeoP23_01272 [Phaeobacter piscinae]